ncbi:Fe3+-citrate ABC transporter substrate-binding protein [Vibrio chagasii]|uniref:Fe3+-citrate ABC transporter substrate-binding protein n=1 Tax=Vibrio chagasii TaxID=170679 RepID=A0A7V7NX88_9VIBR|nr:Fe3+-citrate ABC transporter substrate-binding protein [Vibrio chagasii]KAB0482436.1 Fe3+-citrate ABC transporter substrate-binding protein [Vibrio chagasii]
MEFREGADTRFMSMTDKAIKLHIPTPDDNISYHSLGHLKLGVGQTYKKAIKLRNTVGKELWKSHWPKIVSDPYFLSSLPKNLEPLLMVTKSGQKYYRAMPTINGKRKCIKRSVNKYGKLGAYLQCKKELLDAYEEYLPILSYMGRLPTIKLH